MESSEGPKAPKVVINMEKGPDGRFVMVGIEPLVEPTGYNKTGKPVFERTPTPPRIDKKA